MIENYLKILEESLRKKLCILDRIAEQSSIQENLLKQDKLDLEAFDACVDKKDELIGNLTELDEGFETLYDRIKEQLQDGKDSYKEQIGVLQQLIAQVTDQNVTIQTQEARNKKMVEHYFAKERSLLRSGRQASKAAYGYYKNMSNANIVPPQFMDKKN